MKPFNRTLLLALTVAIAVMLSIAAYVTIANGHRSGELLVNGGFEHGFTVQEGCGMVGNGWRCFHNGGRAGYGFYDDAWERVVASGQHAQLIEINTKKDFGDQDRTAGIYQTVNVLPGHNYRLSLKGLMRANDLDSDGDPWRYVMLVGFSHGGPADWTKANWQEINVGPIQERTDPSGYYDAHVDVTAHGHQLTVFIAGRMKWGDWNREVDFNLDHISLVGTMPPSQPPGKHPPVVQPYEPPPASPPMKVAPPSAELVCDGANVLYNGDFESGWSPDGTAYKWRRYNNGGRANYGYYDDMWPPVVAQGKHAQLLEINTHGFDQSDPDRLTGIWQKVSNLRPGTTYQLSLQAMIREESDHSDEDAYRYEVYWGYRAGQTPISDVSQLNAWHGIPVEEISLRTEPGSYSQYTVTFTPATKSMVLYLFGLKKWATVEREVDFDFDDVSLRPCRPVRKGSHPPQEKPEPIYHGDDLDQHEICVYFVQPGDTMSSVANLYGVSVDWLLQMNDLDDPNYLYFMQPLQVPCLSQDMQTWHPQEDRPHERTHTVKRGQTLKQIARKYDVSVKRLKRVNGIRNANRIYPGQVLIVPS